MDYIFTVRRVSGGKFTAEPGASYFLEIPAGASTVSPDNAISKAEWFKEVQTQARHGAKDDAAFGDIVMYVHGFNTSQEVMLERHRLLQAGLAKHGFEGVLVSFDWPSDNSALNYLEDRTDAKLTALRLVDEGIAAFAALQRPDCHINLHLLAHSMGCYVLREAFDDADDRPAVAAHSWSVSQIIMLSGDISASSMAASSSKSSSLYRHCVRLTNYFNPLDEVLSLSSIKRIGVAPRVGRIGLPPDTPEKAVNVNTGNYYKANRSAFAHLANPSHTWYFYDDTMMQDMLCTINGDIDRCQFDTRGQGDRGNLVLIG